MKITIRHLSLFYLPLVLSMVIGCGGSSSTNNPPPPTIGKAYVTGNFSVIRFPAGGTGDLPPQITRNLLPEVTGNLAADVPHDRVVATAAGSAPGAITEVLFVDNASTTMQPVRAISGTATTLQVPEGVAVDSVNDLVYVLDNSAKLLVFGPASTISGNVAPLRTITAAFSLFGLALDSANNRLFLADPAGTINIFDNASTLNGSVVPNRVIAGAATQLAIPVLLVLDSSGRLIVVNQANGVVPPIPFNILVFANAGSANGNVAPAAVFTLSANQQPVGMAVSPSGELYVVDVSPSVNVYSNITTATGNLAPVRTISGPNTGLVGGVGTNGIALDPTR